MILMLEDNSPWMAGRVPNGYWDNRENRVRYMDWLGSKCGFTNAEDWYAVSRNTFKSNRGGGLISTRYGDSITAALHDYRPNYTWLPWKFRRTPNNFWADPANRRLYMKWLGSVLGFQKPDDWYSVTKETFQQHDGAGLLYGYYGDSVLAAVQEYMPEHNWLPWLFNAPQGFWQDAENRKQYMTWLGVQLGFKQPEDWYAISKRDFCDNHGAAFLHFYDDSPFQAVKEHLPDLKWTPWLFRSVPNQFWTDVDNRLCYLQWLGQKLGFKQLTDWYRLVSKDFQDNRGGGLLNYYASGATGKAIADAMRESGSRKVVVWPVIQLIECSSTDRDPKTLFQALS